MTSGAISDWDDAYANGAYIAGADAYPNKWAEAAAAFRRTLAAEGRADLDECYGGAERERMDLLYPTAKPCGLVVLVHGGYWRAFDKSSWSHLAAGPLRRGWAVAIPSYTLCPQARITEITCQIARAIEAAADIVAGPLCLVGHSAGGHLVCRMSCEQGPLGEPARRRLRRTVSVSGLHDLRPLLKTSMNHDLRLNMAEARAESPALLEPLETADVVCWVGADERPEFLRQSALLANVWSGCGVRIELNVAPGCHHFDVIDALASGASDLTAALLQS